MEHMYFLVICLAIYTMGVRSAYVPKGYLGCYEDKLTRILDIKLRSSESNSGGECKLRCSSRSYRYAGTENKEECHCGFRLKNYPMSSGCNMTCPGYEKEFCGGRMRISIYDTWWCARKPCKNNATCHDLSKDSYICYCTDGWEGIHCNKEISTQSSVLITTTIAKSTVETENNTSSKLDLEDTDNSSSLMTAYVLVPVGCLAVFVSMLVIVISWKKRTGKVKEEREINAIENHIYSEVDEGGSASASSTTTAIRSHEHERRIYTGHVPKSSEKLKSSAKANAQRPDVNTPGGMNERKEDAMYITPIYTVENGYTSINLENAYSQIDMDGQYEILHKNNLCENEYNTLNANKVSSTNDVSKEP